MAILGVIIYNTMQAVSVQEMQELDRRTIEDFGVPSIILMENAGRCVNNVAMEMLKPCAGKRVAIFCGTGNNGGDGFVTARYLAMQGIGMAVYIIGDTSHIKNDPLLNLNILRKTGIVVKEVSDAIDVKAELIIDAILGIGVKGQVKEPARSIIVDLNKKNIPILSIDVPSGLDADTGEVLDEAIKATKTVTMQFPKKGFYINDGPEHAGEIIVADIGILG
ncbi:MAG: NAD(P)H-hydrate epimerase [Candidatus Omnitrophica bacterium]|nr:NAD(P)H-hydrate epimerase [Candidatus Omnitrophota bacterium]MBU4149570.1 NAD(P)H-hydrate epimerase [Candidatus Omnitrophota bacterium]